MFFHDIFLHFFLFPRRVDSPIAAPKGAKNLSGEVPPYSEPLTASSLEKLRRLVKTIRRKRKSLLPVPKTPSAFDRRAQ
jgi:hypothetical protein